MKLWRTIQDLWQHCEFCPVCKNKRDFQLFGGPNNNFRLIAYNKQINQLELNCDFLSGHSLLAIDIYIDCIENTIELVFGEPVNTANKTYFFFNIKSYCDTCKASWTKSTDLEIDILNKKIINIGLESESVKCLAHATKYQLILDYKKNSLFIFNITTGELVVPPFNCPLVDIDLFDQEKLFNKIQTILVFS